MLQSPSTIQLWFLKQSGPSLNSCRNQSGLNEIFVESHTTNNIIFQKDVHSNLRAYYYGLLCQIYQTDTQTSSQLEANFKRILYDQQTRPDQFQIPSLKAKHKQFYNNISLKRLITEMLIELSNKRSKGIVRNIINEYPIMDLIMMLLIRSIICHHRHNTVLISQKIPTRTIAQCFWQLFSFGSYEIGPSSWVFQNLNITFNSTGIYQQIGIFQYSKDLPNKKLKIDNNSFQTIQQASKQDSLEQNQQQELEYYRKAKRCSVTSSFQSIHLKLKALDFQDGISQISRRQSIQEDSFIDKVNIFIQNQQTPKLSKDECFVQNKQPNRVRPYSPLRVNKSYVNRQ